MRLADVTILPQSWGSDAVCGRKGEEEGSGKVRRFCRPEENDGDGGRATEDVGVRERKGDCVRNKITGGESGVKDW